MRLLIIGKPYASEHRRLVVAGRSLGHRVTVAPMDDVTFRFGRTDAPLLRGRRITAAFDVVCFRAVYPFVSESLLLADWCADAGLRVIDAGLSRRKYVNSKAFETRTLRNAGVPALPGVQPLSKTAAERYLRSARYPLVAKGVHGSRGRQVHLCRTAAAAKRLVRADAGGTYLFQPFIDVREEYRVLVLGGRSLGVMRKHDIPGDFRRNLALGGSGEAAHLPTALVRTCERAARVLDREFAGVDLAIAGNGRPYVLEVNRAPGFVGFERATGTDVASAFLAYALR